MSDSVRTVVPDAIVGIAVLKAIGGRGLLLRCRGSGWGICRSAEHISVCVLTTRVAALDLR